MNNVTAGGLLSLYFSAADNQVGYLFNSRSFVGGNSPEFIITASPVPVPPAVWLFGTGLAAMMGLAWRKVSGLVA